MVPLPRGIEDTFINAGTFGVLSLILMAVALYLYRELRSCRKEQLTSASNALDKQAEAIERTALSQERMAAVIEERNKTTDQLAKALEGFATSFTHQREIDQLHRQQNLERLDRIETLQEKEVKTMTALGESLRALTRREISILRSQEQ
jgi:hypothetical protein